MLLPTQLGYHFWPGEAFVWGIKVDFLSPTLFVTDIGLFLLFLIDLRLHFSFWKKFFQRQKIKFFFLLLFCLINIWVADRSLLAIYRWLKFLEGAFLVIYTARYFRKNWLIPLALAGFYTSLIAWWQFFKQSSLGGLFWWLGERDFNIASLGIAKAQVGRYFLLRPMASFSHPNSLAGWLIVLSLILYWGRKKWSGWVVNIIDGLLVFLFLTICLTFSAAAYLFILFLMVFLSWRRSKKFFIAVIILAAALILYSIEVGIIEQESWQERLFLIQNAFQLMRTKLWLGVGGGNFITAQTNLGFLRGQYNFLQPVHNVYLLFLVETGLVGTFLFLCLSFKFFRFFFLSLKEKVTFLDLALLAGLFLGFFDHYWLTLQQNFLLLAIVIGLLFRPILIQKDDPDREYFGK